MSTSMNETFVCRICGHEHPVDEATVINRNTWNEYRVCADCAGENGFYVCQECGDLFDRPFTTRDCEGGCVCDRCYAEHEYVFCNRCNRLHLQSECTYDDDYGWVCEECYPHLPSRSFHGYGYKPEPKFQRRSSDAEGVLTFGVELEVDDGDDHNRLADDLAALSQPIYMKHDGSLGEEGVEIVTHPCSLAYHMYELRWAEITRQCKKHDYTSHEAGTCGLHIHIGRRQMGASRYERRRTAANMVLLMHTLWNEMVDFSRRTDDQLDDWANCPRMEDLEDGCLMTDDELESEALNTERDGRYQAVNLCNDETVELRLFRGTLNRNSIIAAIQLASNLTRYAMTHTPNECITAKWSDVVGFEQFKELNAYCKERALLK